MTPLLLEGLGVLRCIIVSSAASTFHLDVQTGNKEPIGWSMVKSSTLLLV